MRTGCCTERPRNAQSICDILPETRLLLYGHGTPCSGPGFRVITRGLNAAVSSLPPVGHMQTLTPSALHSLPRPLSTMVHSPGTQGLQADPLLRLEHSGVQNHRGTSRLSSAFDPRRRFPVPVSGAVDPPSFFAWVNGFASASCGVQGHRWPEASAWLISPPAWKLKLPGLIIPGCACLRFDRRRLYVLGLDIHGQYFDDILATSQSGV